MATVAKKILIVGTGITGSTLSKLIRNHSIFTSGSVTIEIWDKSRGAGGRASTSRFDKGSADLGLQYLSTDKDPLRVYYNDLTKDKIITPMTAKLAGNNPKYMDPKLAHFISTEGASKLCKYMLTGLQPKFSKEVTGLSVVTVDGSEPQKQMWRATTVDGTFSDFDGVVLTPPVPQILAFKGDIQTNIQANEDLWGRLKKVSYSARWAYALKFDVGAWDEVEKLNWAAKYVGRDESDSICYLSIDQLKRGKSVASLRESGEGPVLVVHAGVPWSLKTGAATPKDEESLTLREDIEKKIFDETKRLVPGLLSKETEQTKLQKWRYSQVYKGLEKGNGSEVLTKSPLMILAGDGFTSSSGFDSCTKSAEHALSNMLSHI